MFLRKRGLWLCGWLLPLFFLLFSAPVRAADLFAFSGLWVVDMKPTAAAWEAAGKPMDEPALAIFSGHRIRVDFAEGRLVEGIVIGGTGEGDPFTVSRKGGVYVLDVGGKRPRRFTWKLLDEDHVIFSADGPDTPPLYLMRERLVAYSGVWKVADPAAVAGAVEKVMAKRRSVNAGDREKTLRSLRQLRMRVDFAEKNLSWEDEKGEVMYGGPAGGFTVMDREAAGFRMVFGSGGQAVTWRILGPERALVTEREVPMEMERVSR